MVMEISSDAGGQMIMSGELDAMTCEARLRYWEEEWISQLLEEAIRLKQNVSEKRPSRKNRVTAI